MLKYAWSSGLYLALSLPALAAPKDGHGIPSHVRDSIGSHGGGVSHVGGPPSSIQSVPEIDASAGLLAVAAVAVMVLFVWERSRRQRSAQAD